MRHLLDDFRRQSWAMKLFLLWGWLVVVIMISSFVASTMGALAKDREDASAWMAPEHGGPVGASDLVARSTEYFDNVAIVAYG